MIPVKRASESGCEFRRNHAGADHKQPIGRFRILISPLDETLRRIGRAKFESRSREEESAKHVDHLLPTPLVSPPLLSSAALPPPPSFSRHFSFRVTYVFMQKGLRLPRELIARLIRFVLIEVRSRFRRIETAHLGNPHRSSPFAFLTVTMPAAVTNRH